MNKYLYILICLLISLSGYAQLAERINTVDGKNAIITTANPSQSNMILQANGTPIGTTNWPSTNGATVLIRSVDRVPIGSIMEWGGITPPIGYFICDGTAVSRTVYSSLFSVIGTNYGSGDGSLTFNLPNLVGRFPLGANTGLGAIGGTNQVTLSVAQMPPHNHTIGRYANVFTVSGASGALGYEGWFDSSTSTNGGGLAHTNIPPYQAVAFIIKHSDVPYSIGNSVVKTDGTLPMSGNLTVPSITITNSGASSGSIPYSSQSGLISFLPLVANQKLFGGTNGTPEYSNGVYFGSLSRSNTAANASVSYTGTGFKPSAIIFITCAIGDIGGSYHCNGLATTNGTACIWTRGSGMARQNPNYVINIEIDNDAGQTGTISSMDNNGFTISWQKQGSPTTAANVAIYYIAFR